ncbi:hypothetical protein ACIQUQ_24905 [Streptomyces sp. NPDC101118]|uniref:hypothetical protein n=1 Tax=Streptomyces sp. NPDC101118 TaxID=3366109 RepID=UPI0038087070
MTLSPQMLALLRNHLNGDPPGPAPDGAPSPSPEEAPGAVPSVPDIARLLAERQAQLQRELEAAEEAEQQVAEEERRRAERERRTDAVRHRMAELNDQLEAAYATLDDLAAALGACPGCFGGDPACRWCRGRGKPGFTAPEPEPFDRLVRPAVVAHARLHRRVPPPTHPTGPSVPRERTHP